MLNQESPVSTISENDQIRLEKLYQYEILDSAPENDFDTIALLAAQIFDTEHAHISFADEQHLFFKAAPAHLAGTRLTREGSPDTLSKLVKSTTVWYGSQFSGETLFYAATPILTPDGYVIGTIAISDTKEHPAVTSTQLKIFELLAGLVTGLLERRLSGIKMGRQHDEHLHRLAHDLKNPVTSISLYAQLLGSREMNAEKVFSMAAKIETSVKRVEEKLNNIYQ